MAAPAGHDGATLAEEPGSRPTSTMAALNARGMALVRRPSGAECTGVLSTGRARPSGHVITSAHAALMSSPADPSDPPRMLTAVGPVVFGSALLGFGALCLATAAPVPGIEPLPDVLPAAAVGVGSGLLLAAGGAATVAHHRAPSGALVATGALFWVWALALHLPRLLARPANGSVWTGLFEAAALGAAAWVLAAGPRPRVGARVAPAPARLGTVGRITFGLALVVFGALHLVFRDFVALLVPAWIPGQRFWAVFTGVAHVAAGLALPTGVLARAGALWVGAMFGSWVLVVHAPRVAAAPTDPKEWGSLFVALAMCGGAWIVAGRVPASAARPTGAGGPPRVRHRATHPGAGSGDSGTGRDSVASRFAGAPS